MARAEDFETLAGEGIVLRKAKETDSRSMLENVWSDEAVYRWMLFPPTRTEEEAADRCRRSVLYQRDHFAYFIALKDTAIAHISYPEDLSNPATDEHATDAPSHRHGSPRSPSGEAWSST